VNNHTLFSEFELEVQAAMSVPEAAPQFVAELRTQLIIEAERQAPPRTSRVNFRLAWAIPLVILFVLAITTLAVGPQKVWAAVRSFFGYLPGVGYVQTDGSIFVLDEAVQIEREGIQVVVEQVVADQERTVVIYKVEGLSLQAANSQGEGAPTGSVELLRLPDGSEVFSTSSGGSGWGVGYRSRLIFAPLPAGVGEVTLVIPRLQSMPAGVAPENWEISLNLVLSDGEVELLPVEEIVQPQPQGELPAEDSSAAVEPGDEIAFSLERFVQLEDGFQLEGAVSWQGENEVSMSYPDRILVLDANGGRVPSERISPDELFDMRSGSQQVWALRTLGKSQPGPWTIALSQVALEIYPQIHFQMDLGSAPQVGQTWPVNQTFEMNGFTVSLTSVTLQQDSDQDYRLEFSFSSEQTFNFISLTDLIKQQQEEMNGTGSGGGGGQGQPGVHFISYSTLPTGVREFTLDAASYMKEGDWQVVWQPPETAQADVPAEVVVSSEICLTPEKWRELKAQAAAALPGDLRGEVLRLTHTGLDMPLISLTDLVGRQSQTYGTGAWISLSPDGGTIAVPVNTDGIHLVDVATGLDTLVPGTHGGMYPVWSPAGTQIAFLMMGQASIYRVKLDGSGLTQVFHGNDVVYLSGWTPFGNRIMYLGFGEGGMAIRAVDVENGMVETWFQTANNKPSSRPSISPDGKWIIFLDRVPNDTILGVYAARIDGSEKKLLASGDGLNMGFGLGVWSPDGQWVAVNMLDFTTNYDNYSPYLINLSSCEVVPLLDLPGEVVGWRQ